MAFPTLLFNSSTGSDTLASGAGPGTAITGTAARSVAASNRSIGFYGATDDLSGVATDGSAVVFLNVATAGQRNFSSIATVKNTRQTGSDGAITSGTAILAVGSTTGWATNNSVKVAGAGAGGTDLYSTVLTVDSPTQATLNDNAGTTVGPAAAWENPKQILAASGQGITATADSAWAIGGKRLTLFGTNSLKLFTNNSGSGDAMEGWILEMESGYTETRASVVDCRRVATSTTGGITLRGALNAGTKPILTFSNNGAALQARGTYWVFSDFEMRNTNATKTASFAIQGATSGSMITINRVSISHSTDKFWKGICPNALGGWYVRDCNVGFCASVGIDLATANSANFKMTGTWVHDCGSHGVSSANSATTHLLFAYNLVETNTGDGFHFTDSGATTGGGGYIFIGNTIAYNTDDGIEFTLNVGTTDRPVEQLVVLNNIFANNGGAGIDLSGTGWTDTTFLTSMQCDVSYNGFSLNTAGALLGSGSALTLPSTNSVLDPQFIDQANANYGIGLNLQALGYPDAARFIGANQSATVNYIDIGVAQRQPPGGSGYLLVAP